MYSSPGSGSWLHEAAQYGMLELVDYLLSAGFEINRTTGIEQASAIGHAVCADELGNRLEFIRELLNRGADSNLSRALISAISPRRGDEDVSLELVRLLVEEGEADVNRVYDVYGDPSNTFTAVEWAEGYGRHKIAAYLRSKGALDRPPQPPVPSPSATKKRKL